MREKLAALAHEQWAGWLKFMFGKCYVSKAGEVMIPRKLYKRWYRQMNTNYKDLPENEKESDRIEADKVLEILN